MNFFIILMCLQSTTPMDPTIPWAAHAFPPTDTNWGTDKGGHPLHRSMAVYIKAACAVQSHVEARWHAIIRE